MMAEKGNFKCHILRRDMTNLLQGQHWSKIKMEKNGYNTEIEIIDVYWSGYQKKKKYK